MSEQKGSYAHVGLPGLRELFFGEPRGMKEDAKLTAEEIKRIYELQAENGYRFISLEAVDVKFTFQQLAEKDATIASLRKALEEARAEYSKEVSDSQALHRMVKIIDAALGEGDKE